MRRPSLRFVAILSMTTTLGATLGTVVVVQRSHDEVCDVRRAILDGFDSYTDALVRQYAEGASPEHLELLYCREAEFRADLAVTLAPVEANC